MITAQLLQGDKDKLMGSIERIASRKKTAHPFLKRHAMVFETIGNALSPIIMICLTVCTVLLSNSALSDSKSNNDIMQQLTDTSNQLADTANQITDQQTGIMQTQTEIMKAEQEPSLIFDKKEDREDGGRSYHFISVGGKPIAPQLVMYDNYVFYVYKQSNPDEPLNDQNRMGSIKLSVHGRYSEESTNNSENETVSFVIGETGDPKFNDFPIKFYHRFQDALQSKGFKVSYSANRAISYNYQPKDQASSSYVLAENATGDSTLEPNRYWYHPTDTKSYLSVQYRTYEGRFDKTPEELVSECIGFWN